jgi:hypothetical protein
MQQAYRVIHTIHQGLEDRQYCTSVFLDVSQGLACRTPIQGKKMCSLYSTLDY